MPVNLTPGDRKILLVAGGVFVVLVVTAVVLGPFEGTQSSLPTTYSAASQGAKAAYLLLKEVGYRAERWESSPTSLPPGKNCVLILAEPSRLPDQKERNALETFLSRGGRILAMGPLAALALPHRGAAFDAVRGTGWQRFDAQSPSAITRAAPQITLSPQAYWSRESSALVLYGSRTQTVVVHYRHGDGEVLWWAAATPLTNAGLKEPGNLEFLLASIGDRESTRVLWDEYFHGYGEAPAAGMKHPLLEGLLVQAGVLALAFLLTFSRRSGPVRPMPEAARLSPLEFVETLGGLYQQARAASVAVDVYEQRFRYWVTRRLGLAANVTPEELERAVRERWKFEDEQFRQVLRASASGRYRPDLAPKQALQLVRALYSYAARLKLFPTSPKEKH
jgi:hypothetical protein